MMTLCPWYHLHSLLSVRVVDGHWRRNFGNVIYYVTWLKGHVTENLRKALLWSLL